MCYRPGEYNASESFIRIHHYTTESFLERYAIIIMISEYWKANPEGIIISVRKRLLSSMMQVGIKILILPRMLVSKDHSITACCDTGNGVDIN